MQVKLVTLRYSEGLQGFAEEALREAARGNTLLEVRDHFYLLGGIPHITFVLLLADSSEGSAPSGTTREDPGLHLPEQLKPLYRTLREWSNQEAKLAGIPPYVILRNSQIAEICRRLPRTIAALKEIEGFGEASCAKYGTGILALIPNNLSPEIEGKT